jgi:hypothetical protein
MDSQIAFTSEIYEGPFRCWKCAKLYMIKVVDGNLESCQPIDSHPAVEKEERPKDEHQEMKSKWSAFLPPDKRPPNSPFSRPPGK